MLLHNCPIGVDNGGAVGGAGGNFDSLTGVEGHHMHNSAGPGSALLVEIVAAPGPNLSGEGEERE